MRRLLWLTIGFTVSCVLWAYGQHSVWMIPSAMVLLVLGLLAAGRKRRWVQQGILSLLGMFLGILWCVGYQFLYLRPLEPLSGETVLLSAIAADYGYDSGYGTGVEGTTAIQGKEYKIRLYFRDNREVTPGDRMAGCFRLQLTTAGEEKRSTYFQGQGIFLFGYQQGDATVTGGEKMPLLCFPAVLRQRILGILEETFSDDTVAFAKALLLGDRRDLDYETTTALKRSGILHIVAVSGMHVSILYGVIAVLTFRQRFLTALVGMPALLLFAAVAGFTPSVTRSCLMVWLMMVAKLFQKDYDSATSLAVAVLVMLLFNPLAVTSVSLQMSAGCVAGILLFEPGIRRWLSEILPCRKRSLGRIRNLFCGSISVTLSATILITPLSAFYFGSISLVSPLTNLLTLWVTTAVFNGLIAVCLLWLAAPGMAVLLGQVLSWPIRYVLAVAKALASIPFAAVYTRSIWIVLWVTFVYVLLAVFMKMEQRRLGKMLCWGVTGLCIALLASWMVPLKADTTITMLNVGQGQSILLQSEGKTFLVDCGGDDTEETAEIIAETLLSQGITRLDGIVLTHFDDDHAAAIYPLLTRIDTDYLFLPDTQNDFLLPDTSGKIIYVWDDLLLSAGTAKLHIFGPVYGGHSNENSLCVLFDTKNCDILITGDRSAFGERMLLRRRELPEVDVLVAGHHGAASSTSVELLHQVKPETVLISVGRENVYGHPSHKLLQRLSDLGCIVRRTDTDGTIVIRR